MFSKGIRLLLLAAAFIWAGACSPKKLSNELIVGMELSYPPFETMDTSGKPTGVSVDLAEALGRSMGRPVAIKNIPFTGLIPSLKTGKIDCIISSMTDTPARRESIAFSNPYLSIGLALLVGKNSSIQSMVDIDQAGKTLVVRQGTTGEVWARENIHKAKILAVERESSAVLEIVQGKADAFLYDQMSVWKNAQEHSDTTRAILKPVQRENWAIGVRLHDEALRKSINAFLDEFRANGGFEALGNKYLGDQKAAFNKEGIPFYF